MSFSSEKLRALLSSSSPSPPAAPSPLPSSSTSAASALSPSSSSSSTSASLTATSSVPSPLSPAVEALIRSYELPVDQSAQEQVELCVEAALACARLGHMRKFGFFLIQAAGLYQELHQHSACTSILQAVQPLYRLHPTMVDSSEEELEEAASSVRALTLLSADRRQERGVTEQRWVTLHRSILEHLIYTAHLTNNVLLSACSGLHLLSTLHGHLDLSYQSSLTSSLLSMSSSLPVNTRIDCPGLPSLRLLIPIPVDSSQQPHLEATLPTSEQKGDSSGSSFPSRLQRISEAASDVFLFSPEDEDEADERPLSRRRRLRPARFVSEELIQVEALLSNPLRLPLHVQSIQLRTSGVDLIAHCSSVVLPPDTAQTSVILTGRALSAGHLRIEGCLIRCFNLLSEHNVDRAGVGIPPPHLTFVEQPPVQNNRPLCDVHSIQVEPPMPLLQCQVKQPTTTSGSESLSFFVGEIAEVVLRISNHGKLPVSDLDVTLQPVFALNTRQSQILYYSEEELQAEAQLRESDQQRPLDVREHLPPSLPLHPSHTRSLSSTSQTRRHSSAMTPAKSSTPSVFASPLPSALSSRRNSHSRRLAFDFPRYPSGDEDSSAEQSHGRIRAPASASPAASDLSSEAFSWSMPSLLSSLPLLPGQHVDLRVRLRAKEECQGFEARVCYAERKDSRLYRLLQQRITWDTQVALECSNIAVVPAPLTAPDFGSPFSLGASVRPSSAASPSTSLHLLVDFSNRSDSGFDLTFSLNASSAPSSTYHIRRRSDRRLLLPLPYFSFGAVEDRQLLILQAGEASLSPAAAASLRGSCLALFTSRLRLSWRYSEASGMGSQRSGALTLAPQLSLEQLAALLAPPVSFACTLQHMGEDPPPQQPTLPPDPSSPSQSLSSSRSSSSLVSIESTLPLVRTVSTVLMQEKLARSLSLTSSASPLPSERVLSAPSQALTLSPPSRPSSLKLSLSGFGPHRVQVGSFVQLSLEVACESPVLGLLQLRLHIRPEDAASDGGASSLSSSSSSSSSSHLSPSLHPPSPVITSGSLSPMLPSLTPHHSVRHVFALCCLAKGRFSYRIHCSAIEQGQAVAEEKEEEKEVGSTSFARLRAVVRESRQAEDKDADCRRVLPLEVSRATEHSSWSGLTPHVFPCPHRLVVEAVV